MADYSLSIVPGLDPAERHHLEDNLDKFLEQYGGASTGGGTILDGSGSVLDFQCEGNDFIGPLESFLKENANLNATLLLRNLDDSTDIFSVDCVAHGMAPILFLTAIAIITCLLSFCLTFVWPSENKSLVYLPRFLTSIFAAAVILKLSGVWPRK